MAFPLTYTVYCPTHLTVVGTLACAWPYRCWSVPVPKINSPRQKDTLRETGPCGEGLVGGRGTTEGVRRRRGREVEDVGMKGEDGGREEKKRRWRAPRPWYSVLVYNIEGSFRPFRRRRLLDRYNIIRNLHPRGRLIKGRRTTLPVSPPPFYSLQSTAISIPTPSLTVTRERTTLHRSDNIAHTQIRALINIIRCNSAGRAVDYRWWFDVGRGTFEKFPITDSVRILLSSLKHPREQDRTFESLRVKIQKFVYFPFIICMSACVLLLNILANYHGCMNIHCI